MEWRKAETDGGVYLLDGYLKDKKLWLLVTYETIGRRRVVGVTECDHGRIVAKLPGRVVAWMPMPKPYKTGLPMWTL